MLPYSIEQMSQLFVTVVYMLALCVNHAVLLKSVKIFILTQALHLVQTLRADWCWKLHKNLLLLRARNTHKPGQILETNSKNWALRPRKIARRGFFWQMRISKVLLTWNIVAAHKLCLPRLKLAFVCLYHFKHKQKLSSLLACVKFFVNELVSSKSIIISEPCNTPRRRAILFI